MKKLKYLITAAIGALIAAGVYTYRLGELEKSEEILHPAYQAASDGCFVAGILMLCAGIIMIASSDGFFAIFGYAVSCLFSVFHLKDEDVRRKQTYTDYKLEKTKTGVSFAFLIAVGAVFIAIAIGFSVMC